MRPLAAKAPTLLCAFVNRPRSRIAAAISDGLSPAHFLLRSGVAWLPYYLPRITSPRPVIPIKRGFFILGTS